MARFLKQRLSLTGAIVGDANAFQDFVLCVSKFYEDIDAAEDQLPLAPDFHRHFFPHPWSDAAANWEDMLPRMPHFAQDHDLADIIKCHEEDAAATEEIQFRLSSESLSKMYEAATKGNEGVKISVQDAMSAYLTTALTQASKQPIKQLITVVNVSTKLSLRLAISDTRTPSTELLARRLRLPRSSCTQDRRPTALSVCTPSASPMTRFSPFPPSLRLSGRPST